MPADHPCSSGYKCRTCGMRFTIGPDGAWWWHCECGGLVEPMTRAEAEEPLTLFGAGPTEETG